MLLLNLMHLARKKGIARVVQNLRKLGITYGMASKYKLGKVASINLKNLERICIAWHCTPNDLLLYVKDPNDPALPTGHPMEALQSKEAPLNIPLELMQASPEMLAKVEMVLKGEL